MSKYMSNNKKTQNKGKYKAKKDTRSGKQAPSALYLAPVIVSVIITITLLKNGSTISGVLNLWKVCLVVIALFDVAVWIIWKVIYRKMLLGADISKIDKMSGEEFEDFLALLYKKQMIDGKPRFLNVRTTPKTCDYGADLLFKTRDGRKVVVQAKRYRNNVPESAVQQLISAREFYKCDVGMVITNSTFTDAAKTLAKSCNVILIDRFKLGTNKMYEI